eukprot:JP436342.1.p1 GENE.JP436342.1~~JP436342.1.p1  ORF type:complete len:233 (-),score=10.90 JP436342.1:111-809(-)
MDYDAPRQSLMDVIQERNRKLGKNQSICRVVYAIRLVNRSDSPQEALTWHETWIQRWTNKDTEKATGILLAMPSNLIHVLEVPSKLVYSLLREIKDAMGHKALFESCKVLVSTQDIASRVFPIWGGKLISLPRSDANHDGNDKVTQMVSDVYGNLIRLGKKLSALDESEVRQNMDALRSKYTDLLPMNDEVGVFLASKGCTDLTMFLDIYDRPIDLVLDSELVWPIPQPLNF